MRILRCEPGRHAEAIRAIYNDAILHSTALYEYEPRTAEAIAAWFEAKVLGGYPVIGAEDDAGTLLGFGTYGPFRVQPAYQYTAEHSVYVERRFQGRGVGTVLLGEVVAAARAQGLHALIGVLDAGNAASVALHRKLGFARCARIEQAGFKFGRWLDVEYYQLLLPTPANPG